MFGFLAWLKAKTSRSTTSGQFIPEIDGLRFIAIFSVILFHLSAYIVAKTGRVGKNDVLAAILSHGKIGVQLFFVISGFVIALPFARGHFSGEKLPGLKQYFLRRLTRLEPPYFLNLLFLYALIPLVTKENVSSLLPHLFASMGYLHTIIYGTMSPINGVGWSLEIELQFYILAPLVTLIFAIESKVLRRWVIVGFILFFSLLTFMNNGFSIFDLSILSKLQFFFTGFLLIDIYLIELEGEYDKTIGWDILSILSWASIWIFLFLGKKGEFFIVLPMFFAFVGAFKGIWSNQFFRQPFVYIIGGMCYTTYLYHFQLISAFGRLFLKMKFLNQEPLWFEIILASLILVPIIYLFSTLLFIFVEKPCMKRDWYLRLLKRLGWT